MFFGLKVWIPSRLFTDPDCLSLRRKRHHAFIPVSPILLSLSYVSFPFHFSL